MNNKCVSPTRIRLFQEGEGLTRKIVFKKLGRMTMLLCKCGRLFHLSSLGGEHLECKLTYNYGLTVDLLDVAYFWTVAVCP